MLADYNISWIPMTGQQFFEEVLSQMAEESDKGFSALIQRNEVANELQSKIALVADLSQEHVTESEFLMGQEPVWSDIVNSKAAERECFVELKGRVDSLRAQSTINEFIVVTGTAGTGKSTALMWLALQLQAEGLATAWMDSASSFSPRDFTKSIPSLAGVGALLINDADIYRGRLSSMIHAVMSKYPRLIIVVECRSSKVDSTISAYELEGLKPQEITMPFLCDSDIEGLISALERDHRLGKLKGETHAERVRAFKQVAGRQLLVAMYEATSGKKFADRATDELEELERESKLVYALISTATAHRFALSRDELVIACGDMNNEALNSIEALVRRKLVMQGSGGLLKARHRVIANLVYQELVKIGSFPEVLRGLLKVGVAKVNERSDRSGRNARMLRAFLNHKFMSSVADLEVVRNIYADFEEPLAWDSHYWLHRGALEMQSDQLETAENFIGQAMSMVPDDIFIQTEWAYLLYKKALNNPVDLDAAEYIQEASGVLEFVIASRKEQSGHAYHILGQQGLYWAQAGISDLELRKEFLASLEMRMLEALRIHPADDYLTAVHRDIKRATLGLAAIH